MWLCPRTRSSRSYLSSVGGVRKDSSGRRIRKGWWTSKPRNSPGLPGQEGPTLGGGRGGQALVPASGTQPGPSPASHSAAVRRGQL